jgi:hemerythrin-like domain-containing protein
MSSIHLTTDPEIIKKWVKDRDGKPGEIKGEQENGTGILRFDFSEEKNDHELHYLQWPSFFKKFQDQDLALAYQEESKTGEISLYHQFIPAPVGVLRIIHSEHEEIRNLLDRLEGTTTKAEKRRPELFERLQTLLFPHMKVKKKTLYKTLKKAKKDGIPAEAVVHAHEGRKHLKKSLKRLSKADPESELFDGRLQFLKQMMEMHIEQEETEIFPHASRVLGQETLERLEKKYLTRKEKLLSKRS